MDTAEGFEQHRAWERTLHDGGYAMVSWPVEYGGRGCNLIEWLIFEEEYWGAGAPGRVNQNGIFLLGPTLMEFGTPEQKARYLPRMARERRGLGAGLVGAERRERHGGDPHERPPRRRPLRPERPEDLVLARRVRRLDLLPRSAPIRRRSVTKG